MKIGVVGAGAWGTALSLVCARSDNDVVLWSYDGMYKFFDGISMPKNISVISDYLRLKETDVWLVVTPAAYFRETMRKMRLAYDGQPVIICTKGAECSSGEFMSEIIAAEIPECLNVGVLSGPQFAAEVARGVPTGSTLAGNDIVLDAGHQALSAMYLSDSNDVIGAQICGVGKNAVALISGYCSVKCAGENERALRFTRAWDEVVNIGVAMGVEGVAGMTIEEARAAAINAVKQLSLDVGIPADLKDIVKAEDIDFLAESAYADACRPGNPRATSVGEIKELYLKLM